MSRVKCASSWNKGSVFLLGYPDDGLVGIIAPLINGVTCNSPFFGFLFDTHQVSFRHFFASLDGLLKRLGGDLHFNEKRKLEGHHAETRHLRTDALGKTNALFNRRCG
jgi:hypothetical protein